MKRRAAPFRLALPLRGSPVTTGAGGSAEQRAVGQRSLYPRASSARPPSFKAVAIAFLGALPPSLPRLLHSLGQSLVVGTVQVADSELP